MEKHGSSFNREMLNLPATILVVDKNAEISRIIETSLGQSGFCPTRFGTGQSALAWLQTHHADLRLVDLQLPDLPDRQLLVRQAIAHTGDLAKGLFPVVLESEGLMAALQELATQTASLFRIACRFHCAAPILIQDNGVATHLYRIAQEADNGVGLPKDLSRRQGMGLRIMQHRAGIIGGSLAIRKENEGGTTVACSIPKSGAKSLTARQKQHPS